MATLDDQKKLLIPFIQRAKEVESAEPKIAYYCRMYALEQGLEIKRDVRAPEITGLLGALMDKLEKDKAVLQLGKDDALYCENFALTVFNRADRVDRAGRSDKNTAMTFYAASYFFEILRHFGEPQPDIQQKQRYAAWRAAEISKAIKEGRPPEPPPAARADTDEDAAMLDELAKLEMASGVGPLAGGASSAGGGSGGSAPAAPLPPVPPPAAAAAASSRLAGLPPPLDDWGAPPPPPAQQQQPAPPPATAYPTHLQPIAPGGPGSAGSGSMDRSDSLDLPSPPKQRPIESQPSGGVWVAPPPQRFQTFQKVLYRPDGAPAPVRGTVAKVEEGHHPDHPTYLVALPDSIVSCSDVSALAPELATGDAVLYHAPSGHSTEAKVAEMDLSHWPPSYLVCLADGQYVDTTVDRLQQLNVPKPRSEGSLAGMAAGGGAAASASAPPPAPASGLYPPPATGMHPPPPPAASAPPPQAHHPAGSPAQRPVGHLPPQPPPLRPSAAAAAPPAAAAAPAELPRPVPGYQPGLREIADATKLTKSATSALQFEDVNTAIRLLTDALTLLTQPSQQAGRK